MTVLIFVLIVVFAIKYRRREVDEVPPATKSLVWLEITWTVVPLIIFIGMFWWGASLYVDMRRPMKNALEINVIGKQWMWKLQHPGGQREIDELHVPVGRPIKLIMTSQDVIHSFYMPAFRTKQDVLPGSYVTQWFEATRPGIYHLFCAEYCGTMHSGMIGRVVAMKPGDYEAWLASVTPDEAPAVSGAKLFTTLGCVQCHGQNAPTLAGLFGSTVVLENGDTAYADENYLRESILNPPAKIVSGYVGVMPSFRGQLSEEQINDLVAYIKSLGAAASPGQSTTRPGAAHDSAGPVTRPVNGFSPARLPNQPPARQQTDYDRRIGNYHQP
jgi:cytochrome c oxidase subunit 2